MTQEVVEEIDGISIEKWLALTKAFQEDSKKIPLHFYVKGVSMLPLLRADKDRVTIFPLNVKPKRGDIVLFRCANGSEKYVIHRVYKVHKDRVMTYGDGNKKPDEWIPISAIVGVAVEIKRNNRTIKPQSFIWMMYGKTWMILRPFHPLLRTMISAIGKLKSKRST